MSNRTTHRDPSRAPTGTAERDPLCEEALRTNRELRKRVAVLERELAEARSRPWPEEGDRKRQLRSVRDQLAGTLATCESERDALRSSPWSYLPWKGYVS